MNNKLDDTWDKLKHEIDKRLKEIPDTSDAESECARLRRFCLLAKSFMTGNRVGSRGNLAEMLYGEIFYNSLLSTVVVEGLAFDFANLAKEADPSNSQTTDGWARVITEN